MSNSVAISLGTTELLLLLFLLAAVVLIVWVLKKVTRGGR